LTSNALWTSRRAASVNGGGTLPSSAVTSTPALNTVPYLSSGVVVGFGGPQVADPTLRGPGQGALERQPHGPVHTAIGGKDGLMSDVPVAAQDPIFWLHHCNIDRLIEDWYRRANGRDYPTDDDAWMDQAFTFTDLLGRQVTGRVRDVLYTPDLGDQYPGIVPRQPPASTAVAARSVLTAAAQQAPATKRGMVKGKTLHANREEFIVPLAPVGDSTASRVALVFDDVVFLPAGRGVYFEVYVNLPQGTDPPNPDSVNFVGTISAFGNTEEDSAAGHPGHGSHAMASHTFDVSQAVSFIATREVTVTLIPVSTEPLPQRAIARVGAISIYQH
jgi:tyrosinase